MLQSGMGGFSSTTIDYVCGLTPKQVLAWYVSPLNESQKSMGTTQDKATAPAAAEPNGALTFEQFRRQFNAVQYADKPEGWWREKYAEFEAERVASERG